MLTHVLELFYAFVYVAFCCARYFVLSVCLAIFSPQQTKRPQQKHCICSFVMSGATSPAFQPPATAAAHAEEVSEMVAERLRAAGPVLPEGHWGDEPPARRDRAAGEPGLQSHQSRSSSAPEGFPTAAASARTSVPAQSQRQAREENPFGIRGAAPAYKTPSPSLGRTIIRACAPASSICPSARGGLQTGDQ